MENTNAIGFSDKFTAAALLAQTTKDIAILSKEDYAKAGESVARIRDLEKDLEAEYKAHPIVIQARELQRQKAELAMLLENARKTAKGHMIAWEDEQERQRKAEEDRLAAEAKAQAEKEALEAAVQAEAEGNQEEAVAILEAPVIVPVVTIPKQTPKVAGHTRRVVPKFRINDEAKLPRQFLMPDEKKIGGVIRALKAAHNIPGVAYYEETV